MLKYAKHLMQKLWVLMYSQDTNDAFYFIEFNTTDCPNVLLIQLLLCCSS